MDSEGDRMAEADIRVLCITSDDEDGQEKASEAMKKAYKSLIEEGFCVEWMKDSDCLKVIKKEENCVYLFDPFGGKSFNHIRNLGYRIFGPLCILSSPEYKLVAASTGKQISLPCFGDKVWEASQTKHIHGSSGEYVKYQACPVFKGFVITVSGLDSEEINLVRKAVEAGGGKYTEEMEVTECTHLIINKPEGAKYEFAKKWKIHIVKSDWLYESIERGYCLGERDFSLTHDKDDENTKVKTSTPEIEKGSRVARLPSLADISCISNVVTPVWMAECLRQGNAVNEDPYRLPEFPPLDLQSPHLKRKRKLSEMKNKDTKEVKPVEIAGAPEGDDEFSDTMSQYPLQADQGPVPSTVIDKADVRPVGEDMTYNLKDKEMQEEGPVFNKKVFMFFGFEEEHMKDIGELIIEKGGIISKPTSCVIPDYGVVPINGFPVDRMVNEIVTNAWVQICLKQDQLLPVSSNVLFSPMDIKMDDAPLSGCVVSVSGFAAIERGCLRRISELLGAELQNFLFKFANKASTASTHLIIKEAGGVLYKTARRWNIPAISKRWLFKCAKSGKREPEENFLIENEPTELLESQKENMAAMKTPKLTNQRETVSETNRKKTSDN